MQVQRTISPAAVHTTPAGAVRLHTLDISHNPKLGYGNATALTEFCLVCDGLQQIDISGCALGLQGLASVCRGLAAGKAATKLARFDCSSNVATVEVRLAGLGMAEKQQNATEAMTVLLECCTSLTAIDASCNGLGGGFLRALGKQSTDAVLQQLRWRCNRIDKDSDVLELIAAIRADHCTALRLLDLSNHGSSQDQEVMGNLLSKSASAELAALAEDSHFSLHVEPPSERPSPSPYLQGNLYIASEKGQLQPGPWGGSGI